MTTSSALPSKLGLIAGEGRFPLLVLEEARRRGIEVVCLGIEGEAEASLASSDVAEFHWIGLGELSRAVRLFREAGVGRAVMAGRVRHARAFSVLRPDRLMLKVLLRLRSRTTMAMLGAVAEVLGEEGVELLDSTCLLGPYLASEGAMTKRRPNREELSEIGFGLEKARGLAELDIGQTVVVKGRSVVVAEAMEGTDRAIERARGVVEGPFVVVKVARPQQDMRFDVPVVGPRTIESMARAEATVLALEAGRVLLLDREALLETADRTGVAVFGVAHG